MQMSVKASKYKTILGQIIKMLWCGYEQLKKICAYGTNLGYRRRGI